MTTRGSWHITTLTDYANAAIEQVGGQMEAFASLENLTDRLDWTLDADELRIAASALEDASDLARGYGRDWDVATVPRLVRTLVLKACKRYMDNPNGYTVSRAGDETVQWNDASGEDAGTVHFTTAEQRLLASLAGNRPGIASAPITAWGPQRRRPGGLVPAEGSSKPFPMYSSDSDPW